MRHLLAIIVIVTTAQCWASEARFTLSEIDQTLSAIAPHAQQFPLRFSSDSERSAVAQQLKQLLVVLDAASSQYPDEPDILLRDAFANAMGHNLDFPGCAEKAISAYERFLKLRPDSKIGNFYYGAFLAGTATLRETSIPYLKKAASLGVSDAHYTAAMVYLGLNDKTQALSELREFEKTNPNDETANRLRRDLERGDIAVNEKRGPPPDSVLVQKPTPAAETPTPAPK
jgi:tetratricopeptide (TPR) repeat protein